MPIRRAKLVAEVSLENSIFDEHGLLRRVAFVVHIQRAAAPGHGAVVHHRAFFAGYALADESGEGGSLLAVEVGFQAVADGFVQQHAGPAGAEDDFHLSGRSFAGIELQDRLAGGFFGEVFGSLFAEEEVEGYTASAAGAAASGIGFCLGDAGNVHAGQRLRVFRKSAIGADHQNVAQFVVIAGANFLDARIVGAGGLVGAHDQFNFGGDLSVHRRQRDRIEAARLLFLESDRRSLCGAAGNQSRSAGGVQNALRGKIVGIGIAGALAGDHADATSGGNPLRGRLHHGFIHHQRSGRKILKIKVGVVAARRKRRRQVALQIALRQAIVLEKESVFVHGN